MEVLLLDSEAYVLERYHEIEAERRAAPHKTTQAPEHERPCRDRDELTLMSLARDMCVNPQDEKELFAKWRLLQQRMYQERADELDAKWPTSHLERKLVVLRASLTDLYSAERITLPLRSNHKIMVRAQQKTDPMSSLTNSSQPNKHKTLDAYAAPMPFEDLPLATQLGLRIFFQFCRSLHEPGKLATNCRVLLPVAARLPALLAALPPFPLSPGFVATASTDAALAALDQSSMYDSSGNPRVLSVFQSLFGLLSDLLHLPLASSKAVPITTTNNTGASGPTVAGAGGILSFSDRSIVLTAYIALCLKWGSLHHLLSVVLKLLDGDASTITTSQFQQLETLFADVANACPEARPIGFQQAEDSCCGFLMSFGKGDHGKLGHGQCSHASCAEGNCTENKNSPMMISATRDVHFAKIDSLSTHSVAITTQGKVMAWGNGDKYRLGHGTAAKEYSPRALESICVKGGGGLRVVDISCGLGHTIALMDSGELFSWGNGSNGRLGLGDTIDRATPTKILTPDLHLSQSSQVSGTAGDKLPSRHGTQIFRHVYCGASHSLAIGFDGRAYGWGKNNQGQCGHGHTNDQLSIQEVKFFRDEIDEDIAHAAGGWEHTLFCSASGRVYSAGCGYKDSRRTGIPPVLGHGDCERRIKPTVVQFFVENNEEITKVACGWDHSLAVTAMGLVYSWGSGTNGKLGHGDEENCDVPTLITAMEGKQVKTAKAGCEHTVLLTDDQEVWTFGQGDSGRLGHGDNLTRKVPTLIESFSQSGLRPVAIAVGDKYNLVLVEDCNEPSDRSRRHSAGSAHFPGSSPASLSGGNGVEHHHRKRRSNFLLCELEKRRLLGDLHTEPGTSSRYEADWVLAIGENLQKQMMQTGEQTLGDLRKSTLDIMEKHGRSNHHCIALEQSDVEASQTEQNEPTFYPQSRSACILFLLGHIDRLAAAYFSEDKAKFRSIQDVYAEHSDASDDGERDIFVLPFAIDTSRGTFVLLLQILRLQCSNPSSSSSTVSGIPESSFAVSEGSRLQLLQRMCVTLSCLRILKANLSKSLGAGRHSLLSRGDVLQRGKTCLASELESVDALGEIHCLVNKIASAGAQGILELFGKGSALMQRDCESEAFQRQCELIDIANAVGQEAAQVLQVGFVVFYPLAASRRELLWELTGHESRLNSAIEGIKTLVLADRLCEANVMEEIFLHSFAPENLVHLRHSCVGGTSMRSDHDSSHTHEGCDIDKDRSAADLVDLMIALVQRSSVQAVSHLEAEDHQQVSSANNNASLRILAILQIHLLGLTTAFLNIRSRRIDAHGHLSSMDLGQQTSAGSVTCPCVVDALLLYLDALFVESMTVLKKLHKASCQHEEIVTGRLNGSFFHSLLPNAVQALCVLLPQANIVRADGATNHTTVDLQRDNLGLRCAHRLLPYVHSMLKMLDEVNWKMRHHQDEITDNQTRHEISDKSGASLENSLGSQDSRSWVLELQDVCGKLCGKLACAITASYQLTQVESAAGSGFDLFKLKVLSANSMCASVPDLTLGTPLEMSAEVAEILQWESNGVFEVENELEAQSGDALCSDSLSGLSPDSEQLARDQQYLMSFIESCPSSFEQLALWIGAVQAQGGQPGPWTGDDGCSASHAERLLRAIVAIVIWNHRLIDDFRGCYDRFRDCLNGGESSICGDPDKKAEIRRRQSLQQILQCVSTLAQVPREELNAAVSDELGDTIPQNASFLLSLQPDPLHFLEMEEASIDQDAQHDVIVKLLRLVTELNGAFRWKAVVTALTIDRALFRIGLCFFHDLLRKLTISSTKSYLLGELIITLRSAPNKVNAGNRWSNLPRRESELSHLGILKSIENLYIRIAKLISADESSPSVKEKALLAWATPLQELGLSVDVAADVIAKAGITHVIGDLLLDDDVGILETHALFSECTEHSALSSQDHKLNAEIHHAACQMDSGGLLLTKGSLRLKPVARLLFSQTPFQSLGIILWTTLCAVALQLDNSSNLVAPGKGNNPLLAFGPTGSSAATSLAVTARPMSGKNYASPRTAVSPRKRLTLPKRTIVSSVSDSTEQVYELVFLMLTKVKVEFEVQTRHAERITKLLGTRLESSPRSAGLTKPQDCSGREEWLSQALLFGNPVPIALTSRLVIDCTKSIAASARLQRGAVSCTASQSGVTVCAWLYIEHTGAVVVATRGPTTTQPPMESSSKQELPEPPMLFALGSNTSEKSAGATGEMESNTASPDATLAKSELVVFAHRVASKRVALTIGLRQQDKAPDQSMDSNADNQSGVTGPPSPTLWETLVTTEDVQVGQWTHLAIVYQKVQNTWTAFLNGKSVGSTSPQSATDISSSRWLPSKLRRLCVGGKLSEQDAALVEFVHEAHGNAHTPSESQKQHTSSSRKAHFEGVLDDVLVLSSPLDDKEIAWLARRGPVLFQLRRQYVVESHCTDLLQFLCQLRQRDPNPDKQTHVSTPPVPPLSTRWVVLFAQLLENFPCSQQHKYQHDQVQVLLCELLQRTLLDIAPSALPDNFASSIFKRVFQNSAIHRQQDEESANLVNNIRSIYLGIIDALGGFRPARSGDPQCNETLQMLLRESRMGFGNPHCGFVGTPYTHLIKGAQPLQAAAVVQPQPGLWSLRTAAGVHLFQNFWKIPAWRAEIQGHIERATCGFLQTESTPRFDTSLFAVCSALGGYCEAAINWCKAVSLRASPVLAFSVFSKMEAACASTMRLRDACKATTSPTMNLIIAALGCKPSLPAHFASGDDEQCREGLLKTSSVLHVTDYSAVHMVHSRALILRFVAKASQEDCELLWQHACEKSGEPGMLVEGLFQLASTSSLELICATLGPDHKKALKLGSIRTVLHGLLQLTDRKQSTATSSYPFPSLASIEALAWKAWAICAERPRLGSKINTPWWQAKKKLSHSLLETMGGAVSTTNMTVTALEHFATVRLGGNVAFAANSGLWFYEVTVLTDGLMQIGYVDADFAPDAVQGQGVGDHVSSWAFDGFRCKKWNVSSLDYGETWCAEDVVGVLLDTDRMELSFFLNGKFLGVAFSGIPMTQTSRMSPAASINVDQTAQFNFGSPSLGAAKMNTLNGQKPKPQDDQLFAFAHAPMLDSEQDQNRLQPVALAILQPINRAVSKRRRDLSSASSSTNDLLGEDKALCAPLCGDCQSETDGGEAAQSSSGDDGDDDDENGGGDGTGSFGLRLPNTTLFSAGTENDDDSNVRDSRSRENGASVSSSDAAEDDALAARRNDLIDGLTGLGFPREWAIRCALETNLSIHESGAVSWILEQMEKDATASSESASRSAAIEINDVTGRQPALFDDLLSTIRSADDLTLLSTSTSLGGGNFTLTLPSAHHHSSGLYPGATAATQGYRPHTEQLSRNRVELFSELQMAARLAPRFGSSNTHQDARRSSSGGQPTTPNLYLSSEHEDVDFGDELTAAIELLPSQKYNGEGLGQLFSASRSAEQINEKPPSAADKGSKDRHFTPDADDTIPLCLTLDSLLTVLYARVALFNILTSHHDGKVHTRQVLQLVSGWCVKTNSWRQLVRFLKTTLGVEKNEPVVAGGADQQFNTASELLQTSSRLQRALQALLTMEFQQFCEARVNTVDIGAESSSEQLPVFHALFGEMRNQCVVQSQSLLRAAEKKSKSSFTGSVGQRGAWVLWLAGVVFSSVESWIKQSSGQTDGDSILTSVVSSTCYSLSFFQILVSMASGGSFVTMSWKLVAFTMMKRVLYGISRAQRAAVEHSSPTEINDSWASDLLKAFESAAHMHNLLDLFALRHRKENTSRVFFSSLTQTIFGLLVHHFEWTDLSGQVTTVSAESLTCSEHEAPEPKDREIFDFCIEALSSNVATISWSPQSRDRDVCDDGSSSSIENMVLSLSVNQLPDPFHSELHDANDHPPRVIPSKGMYTIRSLAPDTRYVVRLSPITTMVSRNSTSQAAIASTESEASETPSEPDFTPLGSSSVRELYFQTPPEPLFQLDAESLGKNLTLLNQNLSVKNVVNKKWHTVRTSVGFDEGVHQWHVRIDTCVSKNIFIGVCTSQASMENYIGSDGFGYGFLANKAVWHNKSKLHSYGEIFKQGDLLQVTLDCHAKTLAFSRNGENLGIAATNLHAAGPGSNSSLGLSSTSESCKWYPAFSLYNKDDQLTITPPFSAMRLADSARQQQQQQHASMLELVEAMQIVSAYQQIASCDNILSKVRSQLLHVAAFEEFYRWRRGEILFRERELGKFIRIDASHPATQRFGFFSGDAVFASRGQATVLGEYNHELWYECDNSASSGNEQQNEPGLGSWSLHTCRQMLASQSKFPVHRHTPSHRQQQYYMTDLALGSLEDSDDTTQEASGIPTDITSDAFARHQEEWARIPSHEALDAQLMKILDGIAASRAMSDPQCLSFVDISTAFFLDKVQTMDPFSTMLRNVDIELSTEQLLARIGLLLHMNRNLYKVVRLMLAEPAGALKRSMTLLPKSLVANQPPVKRETDSEAEDLSKDSRALSVGAKKRIAYTEAVMTTDYIAGLANSSQWNPENQSRFSDINELTRRLLFQAQKAKLITESMRKTVTPTLNSPLVDGDPQSQASSARDDDSYDPSDLPRVHVRYFKRDENQGLPFWSDSGADPSAKVCNPAVFLLPEDGSARHQRSLFLQVSQQLLKLDSRELRRTYATPFEPLPITRTFHVVVSEATTCEAPTESISDKKTPLRLPQSLDLEYKSGLGDVEKEETAVSAPEPPAVTEAYQQSQATQYVRLLEDLMREIQSPVFPLFVPVVTTTTASSPDVKTTRDSTKQPAASSSRCLPKSESAVELDINTMLFSPSVVARCQWTTEHLLLWYFQVGQLLGIAWRGGVLLPLHFLSQTFWQELMDIQSGSTNDGRDPSVQLMGTLRSTVLHAIRDGLFSVVPSRCVVSLLTPVEVRARLCDPHTLVTIQRLKLSGQCDAHALLHSMFWAIVDTFTVVERVALLGFLTGSSSRRWTTTDFEPPSSAEFVLEISSDPLTLEGGHHPDACYPVMVPSSDPHGARLHLPAYSSSEAMRKKLVLAMTTHYSG